MLKPITSAREDHQPVDQQRRGSRWCRRRCRRRAGSRRCPRAAVTMWKFTARRPCAMAKRTALASSQPASSTTSASTRRGRKSAAWTRNSAHRLEQDVEVEFEPAHPFASSMASRPAAGSGPSRAGCRARSAARRAPSRARRAAAGRRRRRTSRTARYRVSPPRRRRGRRARASRSHASSVGPASMRSASRSCRAVRVAERAQHAGDVAQRRMLAPALGERPRRLALEVDDHEVVVGEQHLAEVIVAVVARLERRAPAARRRHR